MAHLILLREKNKIKTIRIKGPSVTIGRNPAHDVAMADPFLLRDHAKILVLKDGDKITLGHSEFIFKADDSLLVEFLPEDEK